jgi:enoyl-CoA hydratase/carnithine racemase
MREEDLMSSTDVVLCSIDGGVATITLNRPEANNGWTGDMQTRYFDLLIEAEKNPDVRAIVVTGAGKSFCPGADMQVLSGASKSSDGGGIGTQAHALPNYTPMLVTKPVIGAINGACAGVGLVQALMFDVRIAAAGAKFTIAFARRGLIAEYGSAWLLPRLVGHSVAMDLLLSSRTFLAEEAKEIGLVNRVVPKEHVLDEALAYAHDLATNCCPTSMAIMKQQVLADYNRTLPEATEHANREMVASLKRDDFKEGVRSFLERRPPSFSSHSS